MKLILITHPEFIPDEVRFLKTLFSNGLQILHLRKPKSKRLELYQFLKAIPPEYHPKIVLHQHYDLADEFHLRGIHITGRTKKKELIGLPNHITRSKSCHSLEELNLEWRNYHYLFLSPIFDSISKTDYTSQFSAQIVKDFFQSHPEINNCIALGGLNKDRIDKIKDWGFAGFALLGDIWMQTSLSSNTVVRRFRDVQTIIKE